MTLNSACAANEPLGAIAASLKAARPSLLCITVHCLAPLGAHLSHSCFLWLNLTTGSHSRVFVIATGLLSTFPASKLIQFITREQTLNWKSSSRAGEAAQLCGRSASVVCGVLVPQNPRLLRRRSLWGNNLWERTYHTEMRPQQISKCMQDVVWIRAVVTSEAVVYNTI
ncbi:hypothetical protein B0H13DRAFT_1882209 [Mycena leptocephala]|nr:hypothetical protein B0H13DRAFT_1922702 [Mycena leptocephala]KAJ7903146.1 hypothetical protein B0H13DRAFT_1882209 [Mycena leptocephala]